jgi:hypothetical protein
MALTLSRRVPKDEKIQHQYLPDGTYLFYVKHAKEGVSENGNNKIVLTLEHLDDQGRMWFIYDNLMDLESMQWKTEHFMAGAGLAHDQMSLTADECIGKRVYGIVVLQPATPSKDGTKIYPAKNVIKDYLKEVFVPPVVNDTHDGLNDPIPF